MTSYSNPFYEYMRGQMRKNGIRAITTVDPKMKKSHYNQYLSYKQMTKKWRYNLKHVKSIKNRFIKKPWDLLNKKLECKKL